MKIRRLPIALANLIAAGEVVERPASVVKELVENAIDAGATRIEVEMKNGGVSYIRVTDNGSGIEAADARVAFERHATSKIENEDDLFEIGTLGFRGEALASMAAVSRIDMFTKTRGQTAGVQLELEAGKELGFSETGCPDGTTVVVRDLFFNVPARMKYLKKDATEGAHAENALIAAALSRPDIRFKLIKDGREALLTSGDGKLIHAVHAAFGREITDSLIVIAGSFGDVTLDGLISQTTFSRANKNMQMFFVNGRPVRSRALSAAVDEAYRGKLMQGRNPACFINLYLHPGAVDVNVHPAKLEVKFARERDAFSTVYNAVSAALSAGGEFAHDAAPRPLTHTAPTADAGVQTVIRPQYTPSGLTFPESAQSTLRPVADSARIEYQTKYRPSGGDMTKPAPAAYDSVWPDAVRPRLARDDIFRPPAPESEAYAELDVRGVRVLGEVFSSFIVAQTEGALWLIDKHAAHEKILYNELKSVPDDRAGQLLLEPVTVRLAPADAAVCLENLPLLSNAGFAVEPFGDGALIVREAPLFLDAADIPHVLSELCEKLAHTYQAETDALDEIRKSVACKAAVKAGTPTEPQELERFVSRILSLPDVQHCPHGRPVAVRYTRAAIEKLFKRL